MDVEKTIKCCTDCLGFPIFNSTCTEMKKHSVKDLFEAIEKYIQPDYYKRHYVELKNEFFNMIENEKVVIFDAIPVDYSGDCKWVNTYTIICMTNYGRMMKITSKIVPDDDRKVLYDCKYFNYKMWLPVQYIGIIEKQVRMITMRSNKELIRVNDNLIVDIMDDMKSMLERGELEREKREFLEMKDAFEKEIRPYMNLIDRRIELDKREEKLRLMEIRLEMMKRVVVGAMDGLKAEDKRID